MNLTGEQLELRANLEFTRNLMRQGIRTPSPLHYLGIADFVLREGQFFSPRPLPERLGYREMSRCYFNSFITAMEENFRYVEGYALSVSHCLPVLHAWNLDADGFVVDRTWNPPGRAYLGVVFSLERIPKRAGKVSAIIDDWEHGFPILRKPLTLDNPARSVASHASI